MDTYREQAKRHPRRVYNPYAIAAAIVFSPLYLVFYLTMGIGAFLAFCFRHIKATIDAIGQPLWRDEEEFR